MFYDVLRKGAAMKRHVVVAVILEIVVASGSAWGEVADDASPWEFSLEGTYWYGSVSGYVQTPAGGQPGTSSIKRPRLSEIGIDNVSLYEARLTAGYHDESIVVDAEFVRMSGSDTLRETLVSHATTFPAGSHVSSDVQMDWYQVMYRHRFSFWRATNSVAQVELYPAVGVAIFDFSYTLNGPGDLSANRSYIKVAPELALEADWRPGGGPFWVAVRLEGTPAVAPPFPLLFVEELTLNYRVVGTAAMSFDVFAGAGFQQMYYEDNQTLPNRIRADFGPLVTAGLRVNF
jgi:hypothetical protein